MKWFNQLEQPAALLNAAWEIMQFNKAFQDFFSISVDLSPTMTIWQLTGSDQSKAQASDSSYSEKHDSKQFVVALPSAGNMYLRFFPGGELSERLYLVVLEPAIDNDIEQLRSGLAEAHESNRMKTAFLANMSHEIRTPLNTIIGFSDLILEEQLKEQELVNLVEMIRSSGRSLLQLVEDIIDISRIEAGQVRITKTEVKIEPIFEEMFQMFDNELKKRRDKTSVELRIGNANIGDACIYTDPYRFRQILINLLSNAIKFTETGYIEFGYLPGEPGLLQFYVKDTGIGIDPMLASKVFQRFGQVSQTSSLNSKGAGLGMAITKQLVELMGGHIWFDSQPGKGTTFYFTMPDCVPRRMARTGFSSEMFEWSKEIFLIVDDVEANYLFFKSLLKVSGALLIWAKNGEEAIRYCRGNPDISLVLMDIQMPHTDGYEATRRIKEMYPALPVIAQTAFADADSKQLAIKAGCDEFITKPINKYELFSIIAQLLRK
ncbi:MAG TPA: ATP-binding protein [Bacteroidales bacterium]|nr:ATP-binding protein [Bacteroidales bacterium]